MINDGKCQFLVVFCWKLIEEMFWCVFAEWISLGIEMMKWCEFIDLQLKALKIVNIQRKNWEFIIKIIASRWKVDSIMAHCQKLQLLEKVKYWNRKKEVKLGQNRLNFSSKTIHLKTNLISKSIQRQIKCQKIRFLFNFSQNRISSRDIIKKQWKNVYRKSETYFST